MAFTEELGATYLGDGRCSFCVWAPLVKQVAVRLQNPREQIVPLVRDARGYHYVIVEHVDPETLYTYVLDEGKERPDPASRFQPQGVHGPSQVIASSFSWNDPSWHGLRLRDYILYELHVGSFTPEGTLDAAILHVDRLADLGITALELMPVAQFPGDRNWGYDGVYPFAVQASYGGPQALKRLVDASHQRGLAVVLDVVYNHLGPEGNYLYDFGPYFTDRYRTPWGAAVNFDGPHSDEVRRFFIDNALRWVTEFHIDALRLDAVHGIFDFSAYPFLQELGEAVHERAEQLNRRAYVIAESDLNDSRLMRLPELGGYGLDAQWNDDFHHALHTLLTGEKTGYYQDFGEFRHMVKAFREGYVYSGQPSSYRTRRHGNSARDIPLHKQVVFAQNHDQVGNRMSGDRLGRLMGIEKLKLAAALVILSPFTPMLFMGEEYGEIAPFLYFVSHSDPALIEGVRKGRREEFAPFSWRGDPPDPQDETTFTSTRLDHDLRLSGDHRMLYDYYQELILLRKAFVTAVSGREPNHEVSSYDEQRILSVTYHCGGTESVVMFHFGEVSLSLTVPFSEGLWKKHLDSADSRWQGPGASDPTAFTSGGELCLSLAAHSAVFLVKDVDRESAA